MITRARKFIFFIKECTNFWRDQLVYSNAP